MVLAAAAAFALGVAATAAVGPLTQGAAPGPATASPSTVETRPPAPPIGALPAEVLRVLDGDTFEARVRVWPGIDITTRVRLRGIDAPEMRARCAEELRKAQAARAALDAILAQGNVAVMRVSLDKYGGRVVADAATRDTANISEALLAAGVARPYGGGRRAGWC